MLDFSLLDPIDKNTLQRDWKEAAEEENSAASICAISHKHGLLSSSALMDLSAKLNCALFLVALREPETARLDFQHSTFSLQC